MLKKLLCSAVLLASFLQPSLTSAQAYESALSYRGQTLSVPETLGALEQTQDCSPDFLATASVESYLCHLMDGVLFEDTSMQSKVAFYDLALFPAEGTDPKIQAFKQGLQTFRKVLEGTLAPEVYGARNINAGGTFQMLALPTSTAPSVSIARAEPLTYYGAKTGLAYVLVEADAAVQNPRLFLQYAFLLPGTEILGIMTVPLQNTGDFSSYYAAYPQGGFDDALTRLDNAVEEYTVSIAQTTTYKSMLSSVQAMLASLQSTPFVDVFPSTPYAEAILALRASGVIQGYNNGTFRPKNSVNRAEFMKILLEAAGARNLDNYASNCFPDVEKSQWYAKYICYGKSKGIIDGYSDGSFRPDATVNLAEALKIVFKSYNINVGPSSGEWYQPYLNEARRRGMLVLIQAQVGDALMRGEMAELMYRLDATR